MKVAIIPARGGSKRIPRKNIRNFSGRPMISYAIKVAIDSGIFDKVIVSTDDDEIALISIEWGAEIPFKRPAELADDFTATVPVISHAVSKLKEHGLNVEHVCCIYPCVPFLRSDDILIAYEKIISLENCYCYPVTEFPSPIQRALHVNSNGKLSPINPEHEWTRSQDLAHAFYDAGQFYWGSASTWVSGLGLQSNGVAHVIPQWRVVDIDTHEDWVRAEKMYAILD